MGKVCVFLADGVEEIEALTVVDLCRRAGVELTTVSITGEKLIKSSHQVSFMADELFEDVDFEEVEMIVLPGGMPGTKNLEAFAPLMEQVDRFHTQGRYLSAICAAPSIYGHRGYLKGRNACSFPNFEDHLEGAAVSHNRVEVSDHFITSRGMGTAIEFGLAIVARMKGQQVADELKKTIVYEQDE